MDGSDDAARSRHIAHRLLRARDWQDRPQLAQLCDWWRSGGGGVCALVGIGGAGKTAIADRFLRSLPGVLPTPEVDVDATLPPARGLFVFSFYDAPNPDAFFAELATWLDGGDDAGAGPVSYARTVHRLEMRAERADLLLVLDGLEKVQDTGRRSGYFGHLLDGRLRDLVLRAADGLLPGARLLITSRFPLFDALAEGSPRFQEIKVERLTERASVALLRQRGVCGPDHVLAALARDEGLHALSVDLLGGYVSRFLGGDPARLQADPVVPEADAAIDPRVAALRQQERRFGRLAERYAEALRESDPAALALLERVCLFRLGVGAPTLASIFTGEGKDEVAGAELARLDKKALEARLARLVAMRLIERDEEGRYTVHPAVRDGFLKNLDAETSRRGHDAAREGLAVSLGGLPDAFSYPSDPATLDLLEEIVYHTLTVGLVEEAWGVYRDRIGGYRNLGWRLGAFERGERICRAFAGGRPPEEAPLPEGLSDRRKSLFVNEWALYLEEIGCLDAATCCFQRGLDLDKKTDRWQDASVANRNLSGVLLLAGHLKAASEAAAEALRLAERTDEAWARCTSYGCRAHARALRGETSVALDDFRDALHWQREAEGKLDRPPWSLGGIQHTLLVARLGRTQEATHLTKGNEEILRNGWGEQHQHITKCRLILADLARERRDLDVARRLLDAAHEWAIARDAKESLCWAALVRARLEPSLEDVRRAVEAGLRIARDCGFGIYHVDLLLRRARLALDECDVEAALTDVRTALFNGVHPTTESGMPELLAATDPECGYVWGEVEGRQLLGEALLLRAARRLSGVTFEPGEGSLPADVQSLIDEARASLEKSLEGWRFLRDPQPGNANFIHPATGEDHNYRAAETFRVLDDLARGILTRRELKDPHPPEGAPPASPTRGDSTRRFAVFLSHNSRDKPAVRELKKRLEKRRLVCWLDEDELQPGITWQKRLEDGIRSSDSVAVLVAEDGLGPWEDEEMQAALRLAVSDGRPVIPVLLPGAPSKPVLPLFLGNRTWVDLRGGFTADGINRLVWGITGTKPQT